MVSRVLKWLLFFIFLFAPQGIKRRKRERMVFDKNTQVCTITCLYNHVDYNLLRADIAIIYSWGSIIIIILFMKELIFKPL